MSLTYVVTLMISVNGDQPINQLRIGILCLFIVMNIY